MENTIENKLLFFAHFLGQKVLMAAGKKRVVSLSWLSDVHKKDYLLLNSFAKLKKKHVLEILKRRVRGFDKLELVSFELSEYGYYVVDYRYIDDYEKANGPDGYCYNQFNITENSLSIAEYQYLLLNSFALEWNGLQAEKLIEYQWVKLKN